MVSGVRIGSSTNSSKWLTKVPRNDAFSLNHFSTPKPATLHLRMRLATCNLLVGLVAGNGFEPPAFGL
jgi:hypothetical protein